jgi:hypothetical protein
MTMLDWLRGRPAEAGRYENVRLKPDATRTLAEAGRYENLG